jgi:hypothetical protein
MPRRLLLLALLAATAALGFSALSSAGGGKYPLDRSVVYRAGHPSAPPGGAAISAIRGTHLRYYRTRIFQVAANGRDDSYMKCPRGKAISGYFASDGGIVQDNSFPGPALRRWNFGLTDLTGAQGNAYTGIVCLQGIGD